MVLHCRFTKILYFIFYFWYNFCTSCIFSYARHVVDIHALIVVKGGINGCYLYNWIHQMAQIFLWIYFQITNIICWFETRLKWKQKPLHMDYIYGSLNRYTFSKIFWPKNLISNGIHINFTFILSIIQKTKMGLT